MSVSAEDLNALLRRRRAIYPRNYVLGAPIDRAVLEQLLENANWAPTHKRTEPWRFKVFHSEKSRQKLSGYLAEFYRDNTPPEQFSDEKMQKSRENPLRAGAVIAICLHPDAAAGLPEFEEIAAVAMAVQNMWLTCTALDLGCYWSTPRAALEAGDFLGLEPGERCLGLFYLGQHNLPEALPGMRRPIADKVAWVEG